jgi:opacity protein-like surface antigen
LREWQLYDHAGEIGVVCHSLRFLLRSQPSFQDQFNNVGEPVKYTIFACALSVSAIIPAAAFAADNTAAAGGFFVSGNIGRSDLNKQGIYNDSDIGYSANVGYRWAISPSVVLGVEGGYTNLGSFPVMRYADPFGNLHLPRASVDGWNLGVNGRLNLSPHWYLGARGGFFHADAEALHYGAGPELINVKTTSNKYYVAAGFGYNVSNNFSVGLNYDYYKIDKDGLNLEPNMVSVSAEYRFK